MNEEYIDNVKHLIEQKDADTVKGLLIDLHPADIAELCNDLNPEEAKFIYRLLDNEIAADVLVEMDEDARKELLEMLPSETIAKRFVDYMDTDDAVDLMRELDDGYGNGTCQRKLEYARMSERDAATGGRAGRNLLRICHRR